jgi:dimethylhistidine N-methyltransferase
LQETYENSGLEQPSATCRFVGDAWAGLAASPKSLPCKYLYDARGIHLFERICQTKEYYPTRTELAILEEAGDEIKDLVGESLDVVDLGSCNPSKFNVLLRHLRRVRRYLPIDIAPVALLDGARTLRQLHPQLDVRPICADFTCLRQLPMRVLDGQPTLLFFAGSTIGNFAPGEAVELLRQLGGLAERPLLLIGVDVPKERARLEAAYDDACGVTAAFNLNLLARANRELGADFDLRRFRHVARYDAAAGRVEMLLESLTSQVVHVAGREFRLGAGESIHTESSYKYAPEAFQDMARAAGLSPRRYWQDKERLFSVHLIDCGARSLRRRAAGDAVWH